jgi:hypothetical protein
MSVVDPAQIQDEVRDVWSDLMEEEGHLIELVWRESVTERIRIDRGLGSILPFWQETGGDFRILKLGKADRYGR